MKKLIYFVLLSCLFLSGCGQDSFIQQSKYQALCMKHDEAACGKYLFLESWQTVKNESFTTNIDKQNWNYWKQRYLNKIRSQQDAYVAIETMLASLDDPYTRFLTPEELSDQNMNIAAKISGIGVIISSINGKVKIEDIMEDSPSKHADIKAGDYILKVNNLSVSGIELKKVAEMIRGPENSFVTLELLRGNQTKIVKVKRKVIRIKAVTYKLLNDNIALIKINNFMSQAAADEFAKAIIATKGARAIVLDLRGNQGGLLQNAIFVANILLKQGKIVSILRKGNNLETLNVTSVGEHYEKRPMVVLVNGMTASAGEILAAALQENDRANLVGEKTYGKGLIQKVTPMPLDTAINITIAKYLTPLGHDINKNGIKPDYEIKLTQNDLKNKHDKQMEKALELLKQ